MPCLSKENEYNYQFCDESIRGFRDGHMGPMIPDFNPPFLNPGFNPPINPPMTPMPMPMPSPNPMWGNTPTGAKWIGAIAIIAIMCFKKGTKITMADGTEKNIEDVKVGDMVMSLDNISGKLTSSRVSSVRPPRKTKNWYKINNTISVTGEHPIFVNYTETFSDGTPGKRVDGQWIKVKDLQAGTNLTYLSANASSLTSTSVVNTVERQNDEIEVYNFEVEGTHNYFADGLLSHNKGPGPGPAGGPTECFVAGTKITMKDGPDKNIEDVKIGDEVLSYNVNTKQIEPKLVTYDITQTHDLKDGDVTVKVTYSDGTITHNTIANAFLSKNKGFVAVDEERCNRVHDWIQKTNFGNEIESLNINDDVYALTDDGDIEEVKVTNIEYVMEEGIRTYDIEVEDNHTFFANGILTHNSNMPGGGPSDVMLKENVEKIGVSPSGINIYEFEFIDKKYGKGKYQGVIAQDVPEVTFLKDDYLWVDYSKIDVEFKKI